MFVILVDWAVAPADAARFARLLQTQAATSLAEEPDCHVFDVCETPDAPGTFVLYEVYTDAAAFDAHRASPHMAEFAAAAEPLTISKTVRQLSRMEA